MEGSIRLRGGRSPLEGRVEIYLDREWGTIGVNGWGLEDANVTCRQLGFLTAISALGGGYFQPAPLGTPVHLDHMECDGDEGSVIGCKGQVVQRQRYGPHDQDSGVICAGELDFVCLCMYVCMCRFTMSYMQKSYGHIYMSWK